MLTSAGPWDSLLCDAQLNENRAFNGAQFLSRDHADLLGEPKLTDGRQLVGHGLALFLAHRDESFAWIKASHITGQRNDLHPVQELIRGIVTHDDGGYPFPDFSAQ